MSTHGQSVSISAAASQLPSIVEPQVIQPAILARPADTTPQLAAWSQIIAHIRQFFYDPDIGALEIVLAAAAAHFHKGADPVWIFVLGPSSGDKCLAAGTPVMLHDGTTKVVDDITVGDTLMGDDSTPRRVLSLAAGAGELYRISQEDGTTYVVNGNHILTLRTMTAPGEYVPVDIPLQVYMRASRQHKELLYGYNAAVEFLPANLEIPPYVLGCWLGDGTSESTGFTSADPPIINRINSLVAHMGLSCVPVNTKRTKQVTYSISGGKSNRGKKGTNQLTMALRKRGLLGNKHIPNDYLIASREQRLQLLAGLIDTDGTKWGGAETGYMIVQKRKRLSEDILQLARSLGFTAYIKPYIGKWTYKGITKQGTYYRTIIVGWGVHDIPVSLEHKKVDPRTRASRKAHGQLTIEPIGIGSYFGFELDGNGRFLLGDCTVTHNSSIMVNCALAVTNSHLMGDLTPKTFLSGYTGAPNSSLLHRIGSGILVFKDFTTFMSKRADEQAEVASQLREIYDGYWKRDTGKGTIQWYGKITTIAACTPALERTWSTLGDLGERFIQVRLARKDGLKQAEYAQRQAGLEEFISSHMRELAKDLFSPSPAIANPPPKLSIEQCYRISCAAELVAHCRGKVPRNLKDEISGVPEIENSSRVSKELNTLVSGHAALFRRSIDNRPAVTDADMWIVNRVGRNSIPINRYLILNAIASHAHPVEADILMRQTSLPPSSFRRHLADLTSLGLVTIDESTSGLADRHRLADEISELWKVAFSS